MSYVIRLALPADHSRIDALRQSAYGAASWFRVADASALLLASDPPHTRVLVACTDSAPETPVATVAIARSDTPQTLCDVVGAQVPTGWAPTPALSVMRLAASRDHQGGALNHAMRLWFIRAAMASDAQCFCSSQARGTPNIDGMQRLGYEYREAPSSQQQVVQIAEPTLWLNRLCRSQFEATLRRTQQLLNDKSVAHRWQGPPLDFNVHASTPLG